MVGARGKPAGPTRANVAAECTNCHLIQDEGRLVTAIESIEQGIALFDSDDRFVRCNAHYRDILDRTTLKVGMPEGRRQLMELAPRGRSGRQVCEPGSPLKPAMAAAAPCPSDARVE